MIVFFCSSNKGKLREFALAAKGTEFRVAPLPGLAEIAPPEETGYNFEENAVLKALYYCGFTNEIVLADDSGLAVDALHGAPGVLSARYAGLNASDADNNALLLQDMRGLTQRSARFVSAVALAREGNILSVASGQVEGEILTAPRGHNGFGYDPLFFYPPLQRAFGELDTQLKLSVSHRGKALQNAFASLRELP